MDCGKRRAYGLYTWFGYVRGFEEKMRLIREAGFDTVCTWWDETFAEIDGTLPEQMELARRYGVTVEHAHIPYFGTDKLWLPNEREAGEVVARDMRGLDLAAELGVPTLVIHPYEHHGAQVGSEDLFCERMLAIARHARARRVRLAVENLDNTARWVRIVERLLDADDNPWLGICFDTGHANVSTPGDFSALDLFDGRLFALHLHDNDSSNDQHLMPYTPGCNVDWAGFARALDRTGFEGSLMLESCYPFDFQAFDDNADYQVQEPPVPPERYLAESYCACARIDAEDKRAR